jgi:hypothetical protein
MTPSVESYHLPGYFKNSWILLANPQSGNFHSVFSFFAPQEMGEPSAEAPSLDLTLTPAGTFSQMSGEAVY